jgi:hypothetical protein
MLVDLIAGCLKLWVLNRMLIFDMLMKLLERLGWDVP